MRAQARLPYLQGGFDLKRFHCAAAILLAALFLVIAPLSAAAVSNGVYLATASPHYAHPVTGVIEDSGSNAALGQAMCESAANGLAMFEIGAQSYLTMRVNLMDNIPRITFQVQSPGGSFSSVSAEVTQSNTTNNWKDYRFAVPSESVVIRVAAYVAPMGRDVVFFVDFNSLRAGRGDFIVKSAVVPAVTTTTTTTTAPTTMTTTTTTATATTTTIQAGKTTTKTTKTSATPATTKIAAGATTTTASQPAAVNSSAAGAAQPVASVVPAAGSISTSSGASQVNDVTALASEEDELHELAQRILDGESKTELSQETQTQDLAGIGDIEQEPQRKSHAAWWITSVLLLAVLGSGATFFLLKLKHRKGAAH